MRLDVTTMPLPDDCLRLVCSHARSLDTLASMAKADPEAMGAIASEAADALKQDWASRLAAVERPLSRNVPRWCRDELDAVLACFVLQDPECVKLTGASINNKGRLNANQRLWLHRRCEQLGLQSKTVDRDTHGGGNMELVKPAGWALDWTRGRATNWREQEKQARQRAQAAKLARMARWRRNCGECGQSGCLVSAVPPQWYGAVVRAVH